MTSALVDSLSHVLNSSNRTDAPLESVMYNLHFSKEGNL
jgi:hypothetical protein